MARINGVEPHEASWFTRVVYWFVRRKVGQIAGTARLGEQFNPQQLVELTSAIAWENYRARFDHAFGVESAGFSDGAACPLPAVPLQSVTP